MTLKNELDFYVPFDHLEVNFQRTSARQLLEAKKVGDVLLNGLPVELEERPIQSLAQIKALIKEVKVLQSSRHPNIQMHLGVTILEFLVSPFASSEPSERFKGNSQVSLDFTGRHDEKQLKFFMIKQKTQGITLKQFLNE